MFDDIGGSVIIGSVRYLNRRFGCYKVIFWVMIFKDKRGFY